MLTSPEEIHEINVAKEAAEAAKKASLDLEPSTKSKTVQQFIDIVQKKLPTGVYEKQADFPTYEDHGTFIDPDYNFHFKITKFKDAGKCWRMSHKKVKPKKPESQNRVAGYFLLEVFKSDSDETVAKVHQAWEEFLKK